MTSEADASIFPSSPAPPAHPPLAGQHDGQDVAALQAQIRALQASSERAAADMAKLAQELLKEQERGARTQAALQRKEAEFSKQLQTLQDLNSDLQAQLEERFKELAVMARLLAANQKEPAPQPVAAAAPDPRPDRKQEPDISLAALSGLLGRLRGRKTAETAARRSYKEVEARIRRSGLFDEAWYCEQNPDVARAGIDPIAHYVRHGSREGRDPRPDFNTRDYMERHPELERDGANPFDHYLRNRDSDLSRGRNR
ncbi:hypothetical protein V8Z80_07120 [Orrella sp. JC864]|uniref:hypothetical protein n=1 Tax=Orrella sp. JC864 TaxID=3120298 RepID=UPI003008A2BD